MMKVDIPFLFADSRAFFCFSAISDATQSDNTPTRVRSTHVQALRSLLTKKGQRKEKRHDLQVRENAWLPKHKGV